MRPYWGHDGAIGRVLNRASVLQGQAHGNAEVLKCLVKTYSKLAEGCQREMSRAVRMALWEYKKGPR